MAAHQARLKLFEEVLNEDVIDVKKLRKLCFNGCECGYRSLCWKLLLNYLPFKRNEWSGVLNKQRKLYTHFIEEMIVKPGLDASTGTHEEDHPLNPNPNSNWGTFFKDNEMLLQIDKDCRRLCPDLFFFQKATEYPNKEIIHADSRIETLRKRVEQSVLQSETIKVDRLGNYNKVLNRRKVSEEYMVLQDGQEAHWEVVERILFIYSKLNPGQGYVQICCRVMAKAHPDYSNVGMNEIIGPIYYSFAADPITDCKENAEADSFFCFMNLMSEIRDLFIKTLDFDSQCGIGFMMQKFSDTLKSSDERLHHRIEDLNIKPQFYAFRWLTLLLSQEFPLPDVIRIWDSLFADDRRFHFLICVCCAILIEVRNEIISGDFPFVMKLIQNVQNKVDLQRVLAKASEIR